MVVVAGSYDTYGSIVARMHLKTDERFSEQLRSVYPGITTASGTCPSGLSCWLMTLDNQGIGAQIVRIYVNSTGGGCNGLCILDPATSPAAYKFKASDGYINSGEHLHLILFWMPSGFSWPGLLGTCRIAGSSLNTGCSSITLVTSRGRAFAFHYPIPIAGLGGKGGAGGTGIYIGPVVYTYEKPLITYTTTGVAIPQVPIDGPNGYWKLPAGPSYPLIIYVKLQTDNGTKNNVTLTAQSVLELLQYTSAGGGSTVFYMIAPVTLNFCYQFQNMDRSVVCRSEYGYYSGGNTGNPANIVPYVPCTAAGNNADAYQNSPNGVCTQRYMLPMPNATQRAQNQRGDPVIVAFGLDGVCEAPCPSRKSVSIAKSWAGTVATTFLGLTYAYNDGTSTHQYFYGVTLPFVAACPYDPTSPDPSKNTCQG